MRPEIVAVLGLASMLAVAGGLGWLLAKYIPVDDGQ